MTHSSPRGPRGNRRRPVLRHHLEDDFDAELNRIHGAGRARQRDRGRRAYRYEHLAQRLLEAFIDREVLDPALEGLQLEALHLQSGGALLIVHVSVDVIEDLDEASEAALRLLEHQLRAELSHNIPRRRTPEVRVLVVPGRGGDA